jgi:hypothetical protein
MTYDAFEASVELGEPVELYVITLGSQTFRYTSSQTDFVVDAPNPILGTYLPRVASRGALQQSAGDQSDDTLQFSLPADDAYVSQYISVAPGFNASVQLYQTHRSDPDAETALLFDGIVGGISFQEDVREAIINVQALTKARSRNIPRRTFMGPCNHLFLDRFCTLIETNFEFNFTVSAVTTDTITVPGVGAVAIGSVPAGDAFVAGFVEDSLGDFRLVVSQGGAGNDDLQLLIPFGTSPLGTTVRCVAGCKHSLVEDCDPKYANAVNYGGWAFFPLKNLFRTGLD